MGVWAWFKRLLRFKPRETSGSVGVGPPRRQGPTMSAADMLPRIDELHKRNAPWADIWQTLNPDDDPQVQSLLIELRGPHLFAPQVGLGVLKDGCRRALALDPGADRLDALCAALKSSAPFVRPD